MLSKGRVLLIPLSLPPCFCTHSDSGGGSFKQKDELTRNLKHLYQPVSCGIFNLIIQAYALGANIYIRRLGMSNTSRTPKHGGLALYT